MRRLIGSALLALVVGASPASATTFAAATCSQADVASAVALTSDGDTVSIPAGTCAYATTLSISNKSITLQGAGIGTTIIQNSAGATRILNWLTKATGSSPAGFARITGIEFQAVSNCSGNESDGILQITGATTNFRFDNNRLYLNAGCAGLATDNVLGVVDHNSVYMTHNAWLSHAFNNDATGAGGFGDESWAAASTMGSVSNLFFEDNTIDSVEVANTFICYAINDNQGARTVWRFNTFTGQCSWANHGLETNGRPRGFRHAEVYGNTFAWTQTTDLIGVRGGTGRFFSNQMTGSSPFLINLNTLRQASAGDDRAWFTWGPCGTQTISATNLVGTTLTLTPSTGNSHIWNTGSEITLTGFTPAGYNGNYFATCAAASWDGNNQCNLNSGKFVITVASLGAITVTGSFRSPFDGNTDTTGYRCMDQAGSGQSIAFSGDLIGGTLNIAQAANALDPVYGWRNLLNGVLDAMRSATTDIVVANRDFYNEDTTNCPVSGATCALGVGIGTRAQRPANCVAGTAWFASDQGSWNTSSSNSHGVQFNGADGVLDICTATNTWTNGSYTPYTYPHPLVSGSASSSGGGIRIYRNRTRPGDDE